MAISVTCKCGKSLKVADEAAGSETSCPHCKTTVTIPTPTVEHSILRTIIKIADEDLIRQVRAIEDAKSSRSERTALRAVMTIILGFSLFFLVGSLYHDGPNKDFEMRVIEYFTALLCLIGLAVSAR